MNEQQSLLFYRSYWEAIKNLDEPTQAAVLQAICAYVFDGLVLPLDGVPAAVFCLMRPNIDASIQKREKLAANGKLGGSKREAKPKQKPSKSEANEKPSDSKRETEGEEEEDKDGDKIDLPREDFAMVAQCWEQHFGQMLPRMAMGEITEALADGVEPDMLCAVIAEAARRKARSWNYISAILAGCRSSGVTTKAAFEARNTPKQTEAQESFSSRLDRVVNEMMEGDFT